MRLPSTLMKGLSHQALGRYQIEAEIGRGAMGVVYRAFDPQIERVVALKTISMLGQGAADEQAFRDRFFREALAAGRLSHPGIVALFDAGEDPTTGEPYLVMEHVVGQSLSQLLASEGGKLPLNTSLHLAQAIAEALDYAHSQGIVHRDIKPANILVTEDGDIKIADFGVSRFGRESITHDGHVVGSPAYMSPEQMAGNEADVRSDVFSLGVVLYAMITGFRPFQGNSSETVCFKVMNIEPVPVTDFQLEVPRQVDAIISRAIAKRPEDRYQSTAELACDIQQLRESDPLTDATLLFASDVRFEVNRPARKRKHWIATAKRYWRTAAVMTLTLSGLSIALGFARNHRDSVLQLPAFPVPSTPMIQKTAHAHQEWRPTAAATRRTRTADVEVEILHHFKAGRASIWFDNELVFDRDLRGTDGRHSLFRTIEMNQTANLRLPVGKHQMQVRVVSQVNTYDQTETIDAELAGNSENRLLVNCDKRQLQLALKTAPVRNQ